MSDIAGELHSALEQVGLPWHSVVKNAGQITLEMTERQAEGLLAVLSVVQGVPGMKQGLFQEYSRIEDNF